MYVTLIMHFMPHKDVIRIVRSHTMYFHINRKISAWSVMYVT
jgi:hypothetical protein